MPLPSLACRSAIAAMSAAIEMFSRSEWLTGLPTHVDALAWEVVPNRDYQTSDVSEEIRGLIGGFLGASLVRAFYLRLPPGGKLHRHRDAGDVVTFHWVIETNPQAVNWWVDMEGRECCEHLEPGCYLADRTLEHWAVNDGATPRTHLLLEFAK